MLLMLYQVAPRLQQLGHWLRNDSEDIRLPLPDSLGKFQLKLTRLFELLNRQKPIRVCFLNGLQLCHLLELQVHKNQMQ